MTTRWLVTTSGNPGHLGDYEAWLQWGGVECVAVAPGQPVPDPDPFGALLLTGGGDVNPSRYGARRLPETELINEERDAQELELVRLFLAARRPVLGICRGLQVINVAQGGRLVQDIPAYAKDEARSEAHRGPQRETVEHMVECAPGTWWRRNAGRDLPVNSSHHQAIDPLRIGEKLRVCALTAGGVIEAVDAARWRIAAVQWHPERIRPYGRPGSRLAMKWFRSVTG